MALLAIDPGAITGWARFVGGKLLSAGVCEGTFYPDDCREVVIECPHTAWRATVKDMITLGRRIGRWEEWAKSFGLKSVLVDPNEWKGSVPKVIHQKRILAVLSVEERARLPKLLKTKSHNMIDAVGIGLYHLGRLSR